jgi:peptidoglycan/LPS O-acetylase OafA/YrhL
MKHIKGLDLLRGLAALSVCIFHFTNGNPNYLPNGDVLKTIGSYGFLGVEVFFVISGIVIPYSMHLNGYSIANFGKFLIKRIIRIDPPYIISIILVLVLGYLSTLSPYYKGQMFSIDFNGLLYHLAYLVDFFHKVWFNPVYWTLAIEFQYYLIISLIFPFLAHNNKYVCYVTLLVFNLSSLLFTSNILIFAYSFYFSIGIITYRWLIKKIRFKEYLFIFLCFLLLIYFKNGLPFVLSIVLTIPFALYFSFDNYVTSFIGNISYSLYLVHSPFGGRIINLSQNFITSIKYRYIIIFITIGITIIFSFFYYKLIEKPFKVLSKKINYSNISDKNKIIKLST